MMSRGQVDVAAGPLTGSKPAGDEDRPATPWNERRVGSDAIELKAKPKCGTEKRTNRVEKSHSMRF